MQFKMNNDQNITLDVEITFSNLYALKSKNNKVYENINKIFCNGAKDFFDYLYVVYVGYICCNDNPQYTFDDFINLTDFNLDYVVKIANSLYQSKKK